MDTASAPRYEAAGFAVTELARCRRERGPEWAEGGLCNVLVCKGHLQPAAPDVRGADVTEGAPDPLRSFRGVITAVLILEGIVVLLALPVVAKLGDGLATWQGVLVGALALALFLACGVAGRPWAIRLALALQVIMVACWFAMTALGVLGVQAAE